jgi:hypothetical protein
MTARPYIDPLTDLKAVMETEPTKRTGEPITTVFGDLTVISKRISDWTDITDHLPCVVLDYHPEGIDYEHDDQGVWRLIPMVCVVYIPLMTLGQSAEKAAVEEEKSDTALKEVFGDLEEVLTSWRARGEVMYELLLVGGGGMQYEPFGLLEDQSAVRMRVGQINLIARSQIR